MTHGKAGREEEARVAARRGIREGRTEAREGGTWKGNLKRKEPEEVTNIK